jgi:hypothetical protein
MTTVKESLLMKLVYCKYLIIPITGSDARIVCNKTVSVSNEYIIKRQFEILLSGKHGRSSSAAKLTESLYFTIGRWDRLCGLVVRVLGYRSGGPGSIPGTTRKKK